ncbi:MAG: hypothetical protein ACLP2J_00340, partial [Acidimicrobiales bacterium]
MVKLGLATLLAVAAFGTLAEVAGTQVAGAAGAPVVANGYGAYTPGATTPPDQFNVMTLVTGGAANVNTASLTVVTQPASGAVTVATTSTTGILTYTPLAGTTGVQTATFAYCAPTFTYPSAGNCTTATMTYTPATTQYMGQYALGLYGILQPINIAVTAPSSAPHGTVFTVFTAPAASRVPTTDVGLTVTSDSAFTAITPIPAGLTYVAGSLSLTGGDANSTGQMTATYCTAAVATYCTAQINTGNYLTTYPYIETVLSSSVLIAGGANVTLPTVTAQFTASGSVGKVVSQTLTEFLSTAAVSGLGNEIFDGYPSCASCGSGLLTTPTYQAPVALSSTTITAPLTAQTVTITSTAPAATVGGATYTPTATATSGLAVTFTIDASSTAGACSIA